MTIQPQKKYPVLSGKRIASRLRWTIFFTCLILFTPLLIELSLRLDKQVAGRAAMQSAEGSPTPKSGKMPAKQVPPEAIVKHLVLAWNRGDSEAVARMFLPNGVLIIPTGSVIRSRGEIRKRLLDERKGRLKESTLSNTVEGVSLIDANTALVKGQYVLQGMKVMGIKTSPAGSYVLRQKRQQGGAWFIEKAEVLGKNERS
jgi:uncharacterized protein (TIGR02246 family)